MEDNRTSAGKGKELLFGAAIVAMLLASVELAACVTLSLMDGRAATYASLTEDRSRVTDSGGRAVLARERTTDPRMEGRVVHPFMGYADPPSERVPVGGDEDPLDQYGFSPGAGTLVRHDDPGTVVVGIFGGSVARLLLDLGGVDVLRARLEESPAFAGKRVVINDLGVFGFKQPQQLTTLAYLLGLGARFDIVVNVAGFNEVALARPENLSQGVFPFYPARWWIRSGAIDADPQVRLGVGKVAVLQERRERAAGFAERFSWSMTAQLLWRTYDSSLERSVQLEEQALQKRQAEDGDSFARQGPLAAYASEEAYFEALARTWADASIQMHRLVTGGGGTYIEVLQPNQYVEGSKPIGEEERQIAVIENEPYREGVEKGYALLQREGGRLRTEGVDFHDLTMLFVDVEDPLYVDGCCHFNEEGNRILGERLADLILARVSGAELPVTDAL